MDGRVRGLKMADPVRLHKKEEKKKSPIKLNSIVVIKLGVLLGLILLLLLFLLICIMLIPKTYGFFWF